jgi:hypothetical protein
MSTHPAAGRDILRNFAEPGEARARGGAEVEVFPEAVLRRAMPCLQPPVGKYLSAEAYQQHLEDEALNRHVAAAALCLPNRSTHKPVARVQICAQYNLAEGNFRRGAHPNGFPA